MIDGKPVAIDIYCGAGGLTEGLEIAGFRVLLGIDAKPAPYLVYSRNHRQTLAFWTDIKQVKNFQNFLRYTGTDYKKIDVVVGGPPCQGFSVANTKTRGSHNGRTELFEFVRVVKEISPAAFVMENVVGIRSIKDGDLLDTLVSKFEDLGYDVRTEILNAMSFGVPQSRRRIFIIGNIDGTYRTPLATHGIDKRPPVTVEDAIMGDIAMLDGTMGTRVAEYVAEPKTDYQKVMRRRSPALFDHVVTMNSEVVKRRMSLIREGQSLADLLEEGKVPRDLKIAIDHKSVYRRLDRKRPSVTLVHFRKSMLIHPLENRLLSLREAARLQSFSDCYRFPGLINYMQQVIGDAVPPLLAKAVVKPLKRLFKTEMTDE